MTILVAKSLIWITAALLLGCAVRASVGVIVHASHRGVPFRLSPTILAIIARETMVRAFFFLIQPLGWLPSRPSARSSSVGTSRPPVLLVVGPTLNTSALLLVMLFLRQREWHWLWSVKTGRGTLADQAERIEKRVNQLTKRAQTKQVDIVAHGCAGLATAWFLKHGNPQKAVRKFITLGTPWRGTQMAVFGKLRHQVSELLPDSPTLDQLTNIPVHTVSIWSPDDPNVVPARSASPDWLQTVQLEGSGHLDLLTSPRALRAIQTALDSPLGGTSQ